MCLFIYHSPPSLCASLLPSPSSSLYSLSFPLFICLCISLLLSALIEMFCCLRLRDPHGCSLCYITVNKEVQVGLGHTTCQMPHAACGISKCVDWHAKLILLRLNALALPIAVACVRKTHWKMILLFLLFFSFSTNFSSLFFSLSSACRWY